MCLYGDSERSLLELLFAPISHLVVAAMVARWRSARLRLMTSKCVAPSRLCSVLGLDPRFALPSLAVVDADAFIFAVLLCLTCLSLRASMWLHLVYCWHCFSGSYSSCGSQFFFRRPNCEKCSLMVKLCYVVATSYEF